MRDVLIAKAILNILQHCFERRNITSREKSTELREENWQREVGCQGLRQIFIAFGEGRSIFPFVSFLYLAENKENQVA